MLLRDVVLFFFFQAEDGIRYLTVTGVQTCAFFFSSRRRHTRFDCDWSSDVCSSDLHVQDVPGMEVAGFAKAGKFAATTDLSRLREPDVVSICVPTPLSKTKDPDVSYVLAATNSVKQTLRRGQFIVLESTTYPGTTRELMLPALESTGLKVGEDFFLAFSPERVDPGNPLRGERE